MKPSNIKPSQLKAPDSFPALFGWPPDTLEVLVEFASTAFKDAPQRDQSDCLYRTVKKAFSTIQRHHGPIHYRDRSASHHDLKQEMVDCLRYIDRLRTWRTPKPKQLTWNQWAVWNLAPFFTHTSRTATLHVDHIAWENFAHFLSLILVKEKDGGPLRQTYERVKALEKKMEVEFPRETLLAYCLDKFKRRRTKHRPRKLTRVLHEEAFKDFKILSRSRKSCGTP